MKIRDAFTFDDVLLEPARSAVLPADTDITTRLTPSISLQSPLISAAMDTVTEHRLAIAMAQAGGIGVVHKNFTIDEQAIEIAKVKKFEAGMVVNPLTITPEKPLREAFKMMKSHHISGIPVVDGKGTGNKLVGILTNRDVRFETKTERALYAKVVASEANWMESQSCERLIIYLRARQDLESFREGFKAKGS